MTPKTAQITVEQKLDENNDRGRIAILRAEKHNLTRINSAHILHPHGEIEKHPARNVQSHCCLSDKNISIISLKLFNFLQ